MSDLSDRPRDPVVGLAVPHESAALHVTGAALYTDDLVLRTQGRPARVPGAGPRTRTGGSPSSTPLPALAVPGVVRVLTAARRPRGQRRRHRRATSRSSPARSCSTGTPSAGCSARRSRPPVVARSPSGRLRAAAVARDGARGDRGRAASRAGSPGSSAATSRRGSRRPTTSSAARSSSPARSTSTSRRTARWPRSTRTGRSSSRAAPSTPPRRRRSWRTSSGCPSHHVTVQCLRMGGGFGGKEMQPHGFAAVAALGAVLTRPAGAAPAQPHAGHDDDRQAARLPRAVAGRLRRRRPAPGAGRDA